MNKQALIRIDNESREPKYKQIVNSVIESIENGTLPRGQQLPSINELAEQEHMAKATVAIAYNILRQNGIIVSQPGKGFYIATTKASSQLNVFVLFDTLNAYKETLYNALKQNLPEDTRFSVFFHHYNLSMFETLIQNNVGNYNYYVLMPHFDEDVSSVIDLLPRNQVILLDKDVPMLSGQYSAIYQDFENDIFTALESAIDILRKYKTIHLCLGKEHFQYVPNGIIKGFKKFARKYNFPSIIENALEENSITKGDAYIIFSENDLITFAKHATLKKWKLGKDAGVISYDDTPVKEILLGGITTISTDFKKMGETAGKIITRKQISKVANTTSLILRKTL